MPTVHTTVHGSNTVQVYVQSLCTACSMDPLRILLQWDIAQENITSQGCGALAKLATSCLSDLLHPLLAQSI